MWHIAHKKNNNWKKIDQGGMAHGARGRARRGGGQPEETWMRNVNAHFFAEKNEKCPCAEFEAREQSPAQQRAAH